MTPAATEAAVAEAERFIKRARAALATAELRSYVRFFDPSKETGALRRASMDLTRSLAELRRPM